MKVKLFLPLSLLFLLAFSFFVKAQNNSTKKFSTLKDTEAPSFLLEDITGKKINSSDYRGKYLVLHFATTWCPFCNAEAPNLEQLYKDYKAKGVEVLIIDVKEDKMLVSDLLVNKFKLSFPVLLDTEGKVAASFAPDDVLPDLARDEVMLASNLLIDPEGKIIFFSLLDSKNFDAKLVELKRLLDERL